MISNILNMLYVLLDVFAFDMYDTDASGVLSNEDVHIMFADLLGKKLSHTDTNKL